MDQILKFLTQPSWGHNIANTPSVKEIEDWIPKYKNGEVINPNFGSPLGISVRKTPGVKNATTSFFTIQSLVKRAFHDPLIAQHLKTEQMPIDLPEGRIEDIRNAWPPISSRSSFFTLPISFRYAYLHPRIPFLTRDPLFVGDLVKKQSCSSSQIEVIGIIRRLCMYPSNSTIYVDLQPIEPISNFQHPLPSNFEKKPDEYILKDEILEKRTLDYHFDLQKFTNSWPSEHGLI